MGDYKIISSKWLTSHPYPTKGRDIWCDELLSFEKEMNKYINKGWIPMGGMKRENESQSFRYYQTIIKYNTKKDSRLITWKREKKLEKRNTNEFIKLDHIILRKTKSL